MTQVVSAGLVLSALRLAGGRHGISIAGLVHLLPFLCGKRVACRLVLGRDAANELASDIMAAGMAASLTPLSRHRRGKDWFEFARGASSSDYRLLAVATSRALAEEVVDAEFEGRFRDSGRLLEYPLCCIDAYGEISERLAYWPSYYLEKSTVVSPWCNRLTYLWGDCCPTGELFPCSLTCSHAVALGRSNMEILTSLGLERLRAAIWESATAPLSLDKSGNVFPGVPVAATDRAIVVVCQ